MPEITIEADTVESALAAVAERLGPGARIIAANRVRRGGLAGFFAREVVEVVAAPSDSETEPPAISAPGDAPSGTTPTGVDGALEQMLAAADEASFAEVLGRTLVATAPNPSATPPEPPSPPLEPPRSDQADPVDPAPSTPTPSPTPVPGVRWDVARLLEAGMPSSLVETLAGLDPTDDVAHLATLARALAPLCGPIPAGPGQLVGPRAARLAAAIPDRPSGDWLHVVVGDDDAPAALTRTPTLVSWVSDLGAVAAIRIAVATGASLGYGMGSGFGAPARRVTALDAAWAVRELMERP